MIPLSVLATMRLEFKVGGLFKTSHNGLYRFKPERPYALNDFPCRTMESTVVYSVQRKSISYKRPYITNISWKIPFWGAHILQLSGESIPTTILFWGKEYSTNPFQTRDNSNTSLYALCFLPNNKNSLPVTNDMSSYQTYRKWLNHLFHDLPFLSPKDSHLPILLPL